MPRRKRTDDDEEFPDLPPPATTLEGRENQLIAAAFDLVEKRIHRGDASSMETVHFLKLGSTRGQLEAAKLHNENLMLQARVEESRARQSSEELYLRALNAMKGYSGQEPITDDTFEGDYDPNVY